MDTFKIGDKVIIDNLEGGNRGIIGHVGFITRKSDMSGFWYLNPSCIGSCWPSENLRHYYEKTSEIHPWEIETVKSPVIKPVLIKVPII